MRCAGDGRGPPDARSDRRSAAGPGTPRSSPCARPAAGAAPWQPFARNRASTDSSPRRELITSPCTKTMSPRSTSAFHDVQRLLPDPVQADHHLQLGAVALLQCRETQLAGVAGEHDAARDADDVTGLGVGLEVGVGGANLGQGVRARDLDRVGVTPLGQQTFPLGLADPELLGDIGLESRRGQPNQVTSRRASLNELDDGAASTRRRWPRWPTNRWTGDSRVYRRVVGSHARADRAPSAPTCSLAGAVGPVCVLRADALAAQPRHDGAMVRRARRQLAPHGKTHMSPQLLARQFDAGACAVTVATISQVRIYRAFGVRDLVLANELVDPAGLRWLAAELDAHPDFDPGVLGRLGARRRADDRDADRSRRGRPVDVCVEVGWRAGARLPLRGRRRRGGPRGRRLPAAATDRRRRLRSGARPRRDPRAVAVVRSYLADVRAAVLRLAPIFETDDIVVTAGGSTYFERSPTMLTGWPADLSVRTVLRSGCYLTHDDGLYRADVAAARRAAFERCECGRRSFAARTRPGTADDGPPRRVRSTRTCRSLRAGRQRASTKLNDQHAYLRLGGDRVEVGDWLEFGISPSVHGVRQVADDPGARRRRPRRRPDPDVLLARACRQRAAA